MDDEIIEQLHLDESTMLSNVICMNIVHNIIKIMKKYEIINNLLEENWDNQLTIVTHNISIIINSKEYTKFLTDDHINKLNQYINPSIIESIILIDDTPIISNNYIDNTKEQSCFRSILQFFGCYKDELKTALI